jgi:GDP/UDP-N,N'-diacetylbacillosamine 2-epimerase (hydrolysing)
MTVRVGVVTVGRSDYGIYVPVLRRLQGDPETELFLIVAAGHLDPKYGDTVQEICADGFPISARVPMKMAGHSRVDVANAIGIGVQEFTAAFQSVRPDIVLLLGDRFEMLSAAAAALPCRIPIAHIHGGELTLGAIDDAIRHAITKLSHIHFAATAEYGRRIRQMGEEPWRVHVTGSPAIDSIRMFEPVPKSQLEELIGLDLLQTLLITYHPVTLENSDEDSVSNLLAAVSESGHSLLFTYPNADSNNDHVIQRIRDFSAIRKNARFVTNLGHRRYHSVQRHVAAMVGNSSSGIIEAASFRLPVVNIGTRQEGRTRGPNIIDVGTSKEAIAKGIFRALSADFRRSIATIENFYGDGHAADRIVSVLKSTPIGPSLILKKFVDYPVVQ